jgi:hypothetical protein
MNQSKMQPSGFAKDICAPIQGSSHWALEYGPIESDFALLGEPFIRSKTVEQWLLCLENWLARLVHPIGNDGLLIRVAAVYTG